MGLPKKKKWWKMVIPIHQQQLCTGRNVKGSPLGREKIRPHGNMGLPKGMKRTINSNCMENICFLII